MVTPDGGVKVLDFGLAKLHETRTSGSQSLDIPTQTPTALAETAPGKVLGTVAYMSPEQARDAELDKRADIWSFGCVLFEMLAGRRCFVGDTASDTLAAILKEEPDWNALPDQLPDRIKYLLRRCLSKDPRSRLRDIGDARIEIQDAFSDAMEDYSGRRSSGEALSRRFALSARSKEWLVAGATDQPAVCLSPDGSRLAYVASWEGRRQLFLRPFGELDATPISGTDGAAGPVFSPDGQSVAFFAGGKLKRVSIKGGVPVTLAYAPFPRGGTWHGRETILYCPSPGTGLWKVPAAGGVPESFTSRDIDAGEITHRWPEMLPGGHALLFTLRTEDNASFNEASVVVMSLKTGNRRVLIERGTCPKYVPTGHLVYARAGALFGVPFDLLKLDVAGGEAPVLDDLMMDPDSGAAHFSLSIDGTLAYLPGGEVGGANTVVWLERGGETEILTLSEHAAEQPRLCPAGARMAFVVSKGGNDEIWILNLSDQRLAPLTFSRGSNQAPIWTPDGLWVTYSSNRAGAFNIWRKRADGSGKAERLLSSPNAQFATSWFPDARFLAYMEQDPRRGWDIWLLPMEEGRPGKPQLCFHRSITPFDEGEAMFSPDGKWVAYTSNETGNHEVYVRAYPGPGGKWQISRGGGMQPLWGPKGREVYYRNGGQLMAVRVETEPGFLAGNPELLLDGLPDDHDVWTWIKPYDVTPDGRRFVMVRKEEGSNPRQINVVLNWFNELRQRAPMG
jgi:serine/threonine-protein kinase